MLKSLFGDDDKEGFVSPNAPSSTNGDNKHLITDEALRIFTRQMKKDCWNKVMQLAQILIGRDADRWRLDAVGNVVCNKLTTCEGCLCHEYDHIIPFSKGGLTTLDNCQILQTRINRLKGNQENNPLQLKGYSCDYTFSEKELDGVELALYGDIKRPGLNCRCPSIMEQWESWKDAKKNKKNSKLDTRMPCKQSFE